MCFSMKAHFQSFPDECSYWNKVKVFVAYVLNNLKKND